MTTCRLRPSPSSRPSRLPEAARTRCDLPANVRQVDFISDLHLQPGMPATGAAFRTHLQCTDADALVLLGDVFEAWVGDDSLSLPFEAGWADALQAFSRERPVWFLVGNRDFLLGRGFAERSGCRPLPDPCRMVASWGESLLLTHGDALCIDDQDYQRFRAQVRQPAWQQAFLARPLAERQAVAQSMRDASQAHQQAMRADQWADVDPALAARWLDEAEGATSLIHGHTHRPGDHPCGSGQRRVLSDWDLDHGHRAEVLRWSADGFVRQPPAAR